MSTWFTGGNGATVATKLKRLCPLCEAVGVEKAVRPCNFERHLRKHHGGWDADVRRRGVDTSLGQAGYCAFCDRTMSDGPDACLGFLPGVSHACCGHGGVTEAFVVIGGEPDQDYSTIANPIRLSGAAALKYFAQAIRKRDRP